MKRFISSFFFFLKKRSCKVNGCSIMLWVCYFPEHFCRKTTASFFVDWKTSRVKPNLFYCLLFVVPRFFFTFLHGTIIRIGIICKKIRCYMPTQLAGGLLFKMLKYFEVMLNIFEFSHVKEIAESWLVYVSKFSWTIQSCFLTKTTKSS